MKARWIALSVLCGLVLTLVLACSGGGATTPAKTATPATVSKTTTPAATTTSAPKAAPSPTISAPKATTSATSASLAGKTITIIVPTAPGGGADTMARFYAIQLSRFLPGKPTIVVRNMPGGGGTIGPNYVYGAKPDGLTTLIVSGTPMVPDLMKFQAAKYELTKMPAILGTTMSTIFIMKTGIVKSAEELATNKDVVKAKNVTFGHSSSVSGWGFIVAKEMLESPINIVLGYEGGGEARRALLSGEIHITLDNSSTYQGTIAPLVKSGDVMLLFQSGFFDPSGKVIRDPALPNIPTFDEVYKNVYGKPPSGVMWDAYSALITAKSTYDKIIFLPPGTPEPIARTYWAAAEQMIKDPSYLEAAVKMVGEAGWRAGEGYDKAFKREWGMDANVREWLRDTVKKFGVVVE